MAQNKCGDEAVFPVNVFAFEFEIRFSQALLESNLASSNCLTVQIRGSATQ
jgi:hypothetical protein